MNNKGKNRIRTSEACLGTFFGTLVGIMAAILFYRLFEERIIVLIAFADYSFVSLPVAKSPSFSSPARSFSLAIADSGKK